MLKQYFAQYLLNRELLTAEQVREALEEEMEHRVKLGVIAMNQGMLTASEVQEIHQAQAKHDKLFGEIAMDKRYLTEREVNCLLDAQESGNLNFEQALIDKNFMTLVELESALGDYNCREAQTIHLVIDEFALDKIDFSEIEEVKELYCEYIDLFLRALVRFMDTTGVVLPVKETVEQGQDTWLISQRMTGDVAMAVGIMVSAPVLIEMARRYSHEELSQVDVFAIDSIAEFLNVTNGLFTVNLSNRRQEIDLEPQKNGKNVVPIGHKKAIVHIDTGMGLVRLIIAADDIQ